MSVKEAKGVKALICIGGEGKEGPVCAGGVKVVSQSNYDYE